MRTSSYAIGLVIVGASALLVSAPASAAEMLKGASDVDTTQYSIQTDVGKAVLIDKWMSNADPDFVSNIPASSILSAEDAATLSDQNPTENGGDSNLEYPAPYWQQQGTG